VVLADDDVLLREGLASLLDRSGLDVVGQAGDAAELIELVGREQPDLAVVDIRMPPKFSTEGLEAARVIQRDFPQTAVMVLSAHVDVDHAMDLLANGQRTGYLLKSRVTDVADFVDALRRVERGGSAIDPALVQELVAAREIARGIHPAILADGGLRPALRALARRCLIPVRVDVRLVGRLPEQVEVSAYYVVAEALTNAARHARASAVTVEARVADDVLRIAIHDDGAGGASYPGGTGLAGLKDRVEALGGRIFLDSPAGAGTSLRVELPLTSASTGVTSR
jgi:DNA-binding NarL/FixJ family response regulator